MTTQQMNYMRYQQMRQSAMRAFVAQAGGAAKEEPVPPPPPAKRHVAFASVEEHHQSRLPAELTVLELDPVTELPVPGREATGTGILSYDADPSSAVRVAASMTVVQGDTQYDLKFFVVNGERREIQRISGFPIAMTDVVPGTGSLDVKAEYNQLS